MHKFIRTGNWTKNNYNFFCFFSIVCLLPSILFVVSWTVWSFFRQCTSPYTADHKEQRKREKQRLEKERKEQKEREKKENEMKKKFKVSNTIQTNLNFILLVQKSAIDLLCWLRRWLGRKSRCTTPRSWWPARSARTTCLWGTATRSASSELPTAPKANGWPGTPTSSVGLIRTNN